jgi:putative Mg2+ transporter-C (MgtC) family protein
MSLQSIVGKCWPYLGDLHLVLSPHTAGVVLICCSVLCGVLVGLERQFKQKPAGVRTLTLFCVGSTMFTLASTLMAGDAADRTRIAAQVVTGVGFLGAGAIIQNRGTIVGLTTGATIWTVAAIGVLVGGGYAAAGVVLTVLVVSMLVVVRWVERGLLGRCRFSRCTLVYDPDRGKTRVRILQILDEFRVPDELWDFRVEGQSEVMELHYCHFHHNHRAILFEVTNVEGVVEVRRERAPRQTHSGESVKEQ